MTPTARKNGRHSSVKGDQRHYGSVVILRVPITSDEGSYYALVASVSQRLANEIDDVGRVALDITTFP